MADDLTKINAYPISRIDLAPEMDLRQVERIDPRQQITQIAWIQKQQAEAQNQRINAYGWLILKGAGALLGLGVGISLLTSALRPKPPVIIQPAPAPVVSPSPEVNRSCQSWCFSS